MNKIWIQGEAKQIDVHVVDDTIMKFKVSNPAKRARILLIYIDLLYTFYFVINFYHLLIYFEFGAINS